MRFFSWFLFLFVLAQGVFAEGVDPGRYDCIIAEDGGLDYFIYPYSLQPDRSIINFQFSKLYIACTSEAAQQRIIRMWSDFVPIASAFYGCSPAVPAVPVALTARHYQNGQVVGQMYFVVFADNRNYSASDFSILFQFVNGYSFARYVDSIDNTLVLWWLEPYLEFATIDDSLVNPNPYSDNIEATSSLAGNQLASTADNDGGLSLTLLKGVDFTQNTISDISSEPGDFSGQSTVTSTASASDSGTTVNITNNTEINTNLELGDAPEADSYTADEAEEKEVADSDELLSEEEPTYTYIDNSSSEYKIDYEKLFDDCKEKIDDIFGTDGLTAFFSQVPSGGSIQPWVFQWVDPWVHYNWGFTVDIASIANLQIVQIIRSICNFGLYLGTLFMSIKLFA